MKLILCVWGGQRVFDEAQIVIKDTPLIFFKQIDGLAFDTDLLVAHRTERVCICAEIDGGKVRWTSWRSFGTNEKVDRVHVRILPLKVSIVSTRLIGSGRDKDETIDLVTASRNVSISRIVLKEDLIVDFGIRYQ